MHAVCAGLLRCNGGSHEGACREESDMILEGGLCAHSDGEGCGSYKSENLEVLLNRDAHT